ncbi:nonribosomal peptide synthetase DhbF [Actinacidiphila yanglinensis]|uniref:Nonribosomal peptide synthetase DhbF n=2 Tax=Actinacidiphila yanglinensis TaxID=310779 RepID=A0A1H5SRD7_9ACTN|nr:nonribosomal peptide synthetase DhbF [Actinacidiphila yanglinensis]
MAQNMAPELLNHALLMWDVDGELDVAVMESAFRHVLGEAEVLRVTFVDEDGDLRLVPRELGDWQPFFRDFGEAADPEQAAREMLAGIVRQPFDVGRDLLLRLGVVKLAADRFLVVIAYHHLVSDGYGAGGLLSRRLAEVYTALARGTRIPELPHAWDAESFAAETAAYRASEQFAEDTEFWGSYLADAPGPAQVPRVVVPASERAALDEPMGPRDRWGQLAGAIGMVSRTLSVPRAEADAWTEAAKSLGVWMSSLLAGAAAVYFRHRCDRPEFVFSLAVGNRTGVAATTPGLAVNVVPLRMKVPLTATFTEIADAVVDETYEIFGHTACHYSDIQRASGTTLNNRGSFGAVMNVVEFAEILDFDGLQAHHLGGTTGAFDELSVDVYTDGSPDSDLFFRLDAPASMYSGAELRIIGTELIAHMRAVIAADSQVPIGAVDVVAGTERERVLAAPADTETPLPELTVPELFARQVARTPDAVAVVSGAAEVSYRVLDERSSRLAAALRRRDVGPETVVAVALPRSVDLVVALLGVAKAGGAYLPIDPAGPAAQIGPVVADSTARVLLTGTAGTAESGAEPDLPRLLFDELCQEDGSDGSDGSGGEGGPGSVVPPRPDNLLAVMYGSEPAGAPGAVAVTHRNMAGFARDRRWREAGDSTVLWHAPHASDALPLDVWVPLLNGGRVVVAPPDLDIDALADVRAAHGITTLWLPAGLFSAIAAERPERLAGLREVLTGGDRVSAAALRRMRDACPELAVVRLHGPTETTVCAAGDRLAPDEPAHPAGALGRPMDGTDLYVLGPGLAPVPAGVTGELYAAGPGLARGCPGRPGQTVQRFVPCPFGPPGARMYRTGDRVRWGADGGLEYLGRSDAQADIRGTLVESGVIEEVLAEHPGVAQAVVVTGADDAGQHRLLAYVVPAGGRVAGAPDTEDLRRFAVERLPDSMVPPVCVALEALPVTANGRVDRASLPAPRVDTGQYRAPRTHTERVLAQVFADVLEVDRVGIDEDFFDLGGNSLRAIRLVGLIRAELNLEVSIRKLFTARTITGLSDMWDDLARSSRPALRRRTKEGESL